MLIEPALLTDADSLSILVAHFQINAIDKSAASPGYLVDGAYRLVQARWTTRAGRVHSKGAVEVRRFDVLGAEHWVDITSNLWDPMRTYLTDAVLAFRGDVKTERLGIGTIRTVDLGAIA